MSERRQRLRSSLGLTILSSGLVFVDSYSLGRCGRTVPKTFGGLLPRTARGALGDSTAGYRDRGSALMASTSVASSEENSGTASRAESSSNGGTEKSPQKSKSLWTSPYMDGLDHVSGKNFHIPRFAKDDESDIINDMKKLVGGVVETSQGFFGRVKRGRLWCVCLCFAKE
eukprot:CAMPEP_0116860486 /NCGR_PEP_ID=MMETSP0418-20121206/22437_1 /TAXON_ID=1158023 /ORGANISM="Astrosyne radiata, Strain 13vi08-1A" /LENGTH=170 /DNA_ID=CAMNT_0004494889 /DNA_START=94 /DNA_END=606 /DNA_ORIENTATION=-